MVVAAVCAVCAVCAVHAAWPASFAAPAGLWQQLFWLQRSAARGRLGCRHKRAAGEGADAVHSICVCV